MTSGLPATACRRFRDDLELRRDGLLEPAAAAAVDAHRGACADCAAWVTATDTLVAGLVGLPSEPYPPAPDDRPDAPPSGAEGGGPPTPPAPFRGGPGLPVVLALLAAVGIGGAIARWALPDRAPRAGQREAATARPAAQHDPDRNAALAAPAGAETVPTRTAGGGGGAVLGRVLDDRGRPLPGVRVAVPGADPAVTGAGGDFAIDGLPAATSTRITLHLPDGRVETRLVGAVPPGVRRVLADLVAGTPVPFRVRVVTAAGAPRPGARVLATPLAPGAPPQDSHAWPAHSAPPPASAATTDPQGLAVFDALPRGRVRLAVGDPGWVAPGSFDFDAGTPDDDRPLPELVVHRAGTLHGRVIDAGSGLPVPGVWVTARRVADAPAELDEPRLAWRVRTDATGAFRFDAVPPAVLHVRADAAAGFEIASRDVDAAVIEQVLLRLPARAAVHLRTVDATTGAPVPGVRFRFGVRGRLATLTSDDDGRVRVPGVPLDTALQAASAHGAAWTVARPVLAGRAADGASAADPLPVEVAPPGTVEGQARRADGGAAAGVPVTLVRILTLPGSSHGVTVARDRTDGAGRFRLTVERSMSVVVVPGELTPAEANAVARACVEDGRGPDPILLTPGCRAQQDLVIGRPEALLGGDGRIVPGPVVEGRVLDSAGHPIAGARAFAVPGGGSIAARPGSPRDECVPLAVAPDGSFRARLPVIDAGRASRGWAIVARAPGHRRAVAVVDGGPLELRLPSGRTVTGRVRTAAGNPVAAAVIRVTPAGPDGLAWQFDAARTAADGSFRIDGLGDAPLTIRVRQPASGDTVAFGPLPSGDDLDLVIPARGRLTGRVRLRDGRPAAGARVGWHSPDHPVRRGSAKADGAGAFILEEVPREPLRLRLTSGTGPADVSLRATDLGPVAPGEAAADRVLDLEVDPALELTGHLERTDGAPPGPALLTATTSDGEVHQAMLDEDGGFRLRGLPPGPVQLAAMGRFAPPAPRTVAAGETDVVLRVATRTPPATTTVPLRVVAVDAAGRPRRGAGIATRIRGASGDFVRAGATDAGGGLALRVPVDATLDLVITPVDGPPFVRDGVPGTAGRIVLRPHAPSGGLAGTVADADGSPVAGALVTAIRRPAAAATAGVSIDLRPGPDGPAPERPFTADRRTTRTDGDGRFDLGAPDGTWRVTVGRPGSTGPVAASPATWSRTASPPLHLQVAPGRALRLRLLDEEGAPDAGARLDLRVPVGSGGPAWTLTLHTGPDGTIALPGLPPGPVTVVRPGGVPGDRRREFEPGPTDGPFVEW